MISGVSISPRRHRFGLYFSLYRTNIGRPEVLAFLKKVLRHIRGNVIVLWDNSKTHQGAPIEALLERHSRLHIERLPPYAPELNPDEGVWGYAKSELANGQARSADELTVNLLEALQTMRGSQRHLRACMHRSQLAFF